MNEKIFDAAKEFEKMTEFCLEETDAKIAANHRQNMLCVLKKFFEEARADNRVDDFVTLFGAYCNFYVIKNFHQVLPEKDFGISDLWDTITDENFQKYLSLIRQGIFEQNEKSFKDALKLKSYTGYSLPHLYRFIFAVQKYDQAAGAGKHSAKKPKDFLDVAYEHYNKMNPALREYALGTGKFVRESFNPALDENFLPYVKAVDKIQAHVFNISKAIIEWYPDLKEALSDFQAKDSATVDLNKILMPVMVFKEKLDYLEEIFNHGKLYEAVFDSSPAPAKFRDSAPVFRVAYLKIPLEISNAGSFLLDQIEKLKLQKKRDELVRDFTHRYKNLQATRLGEIAESLLKMDDEQEKKWGRELLLEQARKETLTKEAAMLHMRYSGNIDRLINSLKTSLADDGEKISEILQMAALNCFIEFFYDETGGDAKIMREQVKHLWENLDDKKISFERQVIFDKKNTLDWLQENGFLLKIKIDARWQELSLNRNDYAEIFLRTIFLEMLKNFLKHGEPEKPLELTLHADETALKVSMRNFISETKNLIPSTKYGLKSMDDTLKTLYVGQKLPVPENCVRYSQVYELFATELEMPAEIFLKGELIDE